jgi:hypothetical protein
MYTIELSVFGMVSRWYQLGLLLVVFGGFLATNSTGFFAESGIWVMFLGLLLGIGGVLPSEPPST